jgi:hypothetical protein
MTRERLRFWLAAAAILTVGLLLRLWFIHAMARVAGDSLVYGDIAKNWLRDGVYGFRETGALPGTTMLRPTLIRLPGYPLFLAFCFRLFGMEHYRAVLYAQAGVDMCSCVLAAATAARLFGRRVALPVLALAALCPFTANYTAAALTETLTLFTIALAFYATARWQAAGRGFNRWLFLTAAALSYGLLLRPEQGLLSAAVIPAMLWIALRPVWPAPSRAALLRAASPIVACALLTLLPLVPWTIRNWHTFHVFQPLAPRSASDPGEAQTSNGFDRWYRTWAIDYAATEDVYWRYDGDSLFLDAVPARAFDVRTQPSAASLRDRTAALFDRYNENTSATPEIDAAFNALATEFARAHPIRTWLLLPVARVLNMAFRPRTELMQIELRWWHYHDHRAQTVFATAYAALDIAYFGAAFAGLRRWRKLGWLGTGALAAGMAATILLRAALLLTLDNSEPRYTLEFFPVLFVYSGALFYRSGQGDRVAARGSCKREPR